MAAQLGAQEANPAEYPAQGVAFGANPDNNNAAVIASMPPNMQQMYDNMNHRVQNTLLKQTKLNTVGI